MEESGKDTIMYCFHSRVRFSEVDQHNYLSLGAIIDYFQDASTFHSEDIGMGMDYVQNQDLAWILSSWQVDVSRYQKIGENLKVGTYPYEFKGCFGHRNYYLEDGDGVKTVCGNSLWTLLNMKTMHPVKIGKEIPEKYGIEEKLAMEYLPRKIVIPEVEKDGCLEKEAVLVRRYHLDSNRHVNNGQYIKIAMESIPEDFIVKRMRAEYKNSAKLGDIMIPMVYYQEEKYTVVLCDTNRNVYAIVEFQ